MFLCSSYTTANAESDYERDSDRESDDGEDEVSCETVKIGRRDSLDLELEVASGPVAAALDAAGSPGPEDVLPLLQQADELHQGGEQDRREGFQLLLNNKLAVRLWRPVCPTSPGSGGRLVLLTSLPEAIGRERRGELAASARTPPGLHVLWAWLYRLPRATSPQPSASWRAVAKELYHSQWREVWKELEYFFPLLFPLWQSLSCLPYLKFPS